MPIRDLTDDEFDIALGIVLTLIRLQGRCAEWYKFEALIRSRILTRGQFNSLKLILKKVKEKPSVPPLRKHRALYKVRSRKLVTLATKA